MTATVSTSTAPLASSRPSIHAQSSLTTIGRSLIALLFIVSGIQKALAFSAVAGWMASLGLPLAPYALGATIVLEVGAGMALLAGWHQRALAWLLAAFVVAATLVFHAFWAVPADQVADQLTHFLKNAAIVGGLILVAAQRRPT